MCFLLKKYSVHGLPLATCLLIALKPIDELLSFGGGQAALAEWLRRWTWNPMGSPRVGSNPAGSALFNGGRSSKATPNVQLFHRQVTSLMTLILKTEDDFCDFNSDQPWFQLFQCFYHFEPTLTAPNRGRSTICPFSLFTGNCVDCSDFSDFFILVHL